MTSTATPCVFGCGSLVSPSSIARTVGPDVVPTVGSRQATLLGYGGRWNDGSLTKRANWRHEGERIEYGVVISLGLVAADEECNGVVIEVTERRRFR